MYMIMDYHLIFVVVSIFVYFVSLVMVFYKPDIDQLYVGIVLAGSNIFFCWPAALGFFQIGLVGMNLTTGNASVSGYEDMANFYMIFFGMFMINIGIIAYGFLNVISKKSAELLIQNKKPRWRDQ